MFSLPFRYLCKFDIITINFVAIRGVDSPQIGSIRSDRVVSIKLIILDGVVVPYVLFLVY